VRVRGWVNVVACCVVAWWCVLLNAGVDTQMLRTEQIELWRTCINAALVYVSGNIGQSVLHDVCVVNPRSLDCL
jgi:hypothetical protein